MSEIPAEMYLLAGVTAAGKSKISMILAEEMSAEILSCDSVAVYKGMDIGSAKPSIQERKKLPHHGIDLVEVNEVFSVADYQVYIQKTFEEIKEKKKPIVVVGGSGFYLQSFLSPVVDDIEVSEETRAEVEELYSQKGLEGILASLKKLNPDGLGEMDTLNPRRVMRGLERCLASGKSILELKNEFEKKPNPFPEFEKQVLWLDRENEDLERRISDRSQKMLESGLLRETEELLNAGIEGNAPASNAVGYRECIAHLKGDLPGEQLLEAINYSTRRLVSKQRKWFRKHLGESARIVMDQSFELDDPGRLNWIRHS
jgi:tRNA dimethylallyltransferase